jgi:hypothetical protein
MVHLTQPVPSARNLMHPPPHPYPHPEPADWSVPGVRALWEGGRSADHAKAFQHVLSTTGEDSVMRLRAKLLLWFRR